MKVTVLDGEGQTTCLHWAPVSVFPQAAFRLEQRACITSLPDHTADNLLQSRLLGLGRWGYVIGKAALILAARCVDTRIRLRRCYRQFAERGHVEQEKEKETHREELDGRLGDACSAPERAQQPSLHGWLLGAWLWRRTAVDRQRGAARTAVRRWRTISGALRGDQVARVSGRGRRTCRIDTQRTSRW